MIRNFLNKEYKFVISAALMIGFFSLLSRVLGLLRNRIFADKFGAGEEMDMYFAAFRLPDFVYNIFVVGLVTIVFIPVFLKYKQRSEKEALYLTNLVLNVFFGLVVLVCALMFVFASKIIPFFVFGFSEQNIQTTITLTRIMLLSPIILGASSILISFLQANKRFMSFALAPVLYNIGIIFGALFFVDKFGVLGLAFGVVLGAFLHFLIQIPPTIKLGFKYSPKFDISHPALKEMFFLALPRLIGIFAYQANFIVITAIGSSLASGSISVFNYANDLQYIPIGIFAISFVTAVFPALSESYAKKDIKGFLDKFYTTTNQILFLVIPMSVFLILERAQIVRVVLGTGEFGWVDTRLTAAALGLFALSIFSQSLVPLFSRAFFAMGNSKTPVFINVSSLVLNIFLSFYFVNLLKSGGWFAANFAEVLKVADIPDISVLGLPLAFSVASIINLLWLYFALSNKIEEFSSSKILFSVNRINIAVLAMGAAIYPMLYFMANTVNMHTFWGIFLQGAVAFFVGFFVYLFVAYLLKIPAFFAFWEALTLPIKKMFLSKTYSAEVNGSDKL